MNYELAKQLKDARFPQMPRVVTAKTPFSEITSTTSYETNDVKIPTLEELIEACGDGFSGLINWHDGKFSATGMRNGIEIDVSGSTPTEAVANLWLALNKK